MRGIATFSTSAGMQKSCPIKPLAAAQHTCSGVPSVAPAPRAACFRPSYEASCPEESSACRAAVAPSPRQSEPTPPSPRTMESAAAAVEAYRVGSPTWRRALHGWDSAARGPSLHRCAASLAAASLSSEARSVCVCVCL